MRSQDRALHYSASRGKNDVLLAPQERMTMQTAIDGETLLQQQA